MARILIATRGTHGDHFPFFMIGRALVRRGHHVTLAVNSAMQGHARRFGLPVIDCGFPMGRDVARHGAASWNFWAPRMPGSVDPWKNMDAFFGACRTADLLVHSSLFHPGALAEVMTGIPRISLCFTPFQVCTGASENQAMYDPRRQKVIAAQSELFFKGLCRLAVKFTLPGQVFTLEWWEENLISKHMLLAVSPGFVTPAGRFSGAPSTGFIFYEDPAPWQPDPALEGFLETDPPALALCFSSLPLENPARILGIHARAAKKLGMRLLVQSGWAGFRAAHLPADVDPSQVMIRDFIPHDWLLPKVCALIHHGGTGTTGRALKNACPMLVEPFGNDQFFNAARVLHLGTGAAVHPFDITPEGMARVLEAKVLSRFYRRKAKVLAKEISKETGLKTACDVIEQLAD